ncbi:acyl carrier protein [Sphingopyxis sp. YR583]|jgi:acyl carrier protein|uniref:acyl carrier protein n=1 Tax=Sphingopyxis sp. YR583 TaxID=1881047 RepID=UPI0008A7A9E7|nr:acyl carrier protein [Sphingopyxis sp. YR583]SEH18298.1 acyl carrier protein [Sphingopyxis sp. YR583]
MMDSAIWDQLTALVRGQFKDETLEVTPETTARDVPGWDSLAHIRFILAAEKAFGIKFRTAEISSFENLGDLAAMIAQKT